MLKRTPALKRVHLLLALIFPVSAGQIRPLIKDFIGLNGHTVQFKPDLYAPIARLARDYHPISWDLDKNTSEPAPFPFAKNRVNWDTVYRSWQKEGWNTNACLMFDRIQPTDWKDLENDARRYGQNFAREFGPSGTRRLVQSIEIGNEPGNWSDEHYRQMFQSMAQGVRKGDPEIKIASCNLTIGPSGKYEKSVSCLNEFSDLVDVLTIHTYAQLENWPTWKRSFPEDPALPNYIKDVEKLCTWRDKHMPGKPVWITEFGYDSSTKPQLESGTFSKWVGVTDKQQAQWLVRSLLVFSSMPVERAYIYFFNDSDEAQLHASSGLTRNFQPKPSFHAVTHLQKTLGNSRFTRIVKNEPGKVRIQEYQDEENPDRFIWVIWHPGSEDIPRSIKLPKRPGKLVATSKMPLSPRRPNQGGIEILTNFDLDIQIDGSPLFLTFEKE